jgi:hypothetical protein
MDHIKALQPLEPLTARFNTMSLQAKRYNAKILPK